jgi:beta-lactamase class A
VDANEIFEELAVTGTAFAAPIHGPGTGVNGERPMSPASVAKIQIALAVEDAIATGALDGTQQRVLPARPRTPGPTGISLLQDEVHMSVRDLVRQVLTISDNVATDELIALVGTDRINELTAGLGLSDTRITGDLRSLLDGMAREAGFGDYAALTTHDPAVRPPSLAQIRLSLHTSAALDPSRGWVTTATNTVDLLRAIWTDTAAAPAACASVREAMAQQLTRHRIASGFAPNVAVAAKSGGLMGLIRNEAAVVTFPDQQQYAVAVFTRCTPDTTTSPGRIDTGIGRVSRALIDELRSR